MLASARTEGRSSGDALEFQKTSIDQELQWHSLLNKVRVLSAHGHRKQLSCHIASPALLIKGANDAPHAKLRSAKTRATPRHPSVSSAPLRTGRILTLHVTSVLLEGHTLLGAFCDVGHHAVTCKTRRRPFNLPLASFTAAVIVSWQRRSASRAQLKRDLHHS